MIYKEKLSNGIRVICETMPSFHSVSIGVWVSVGSVLENAQTSGSSHFIEHMLFKGTTKRSASDIAAEMDALGGNLNAFTAKECTCFYAKVLDEHIDKAVDMLSDIFLNSKFAADDIEREKGVVCEEILMTEDSPEDVAHENLCSLMYAGAPLEREILGSEDSVRSFTRDGLLSFMGSHYTTGNIVISCAGSFDKDKLITLLEEKFSKTKKTLEQESSYNALAGGKRFNAIKKDIEQVHICLGFPGFSIDEDGQYPLYVLNNAFGGSMSSRLFQKVREEKGLAYSIYSYPTSYIDTGSFTIYAGTGEKQANEVLRLMLDEIVLIRENGITEEEYIRSKEQLKGSYMLGQESTGARCNAIGKGELLRGRIYTDEEVLSRIENVSMDDVRKAINRSLDCSNMSAVFVGRVQKHEEKLKKLIMDA